LGKKRGLGREQKKGDGKKPLEVHLQPLQDKACGWAGTVLQIWGRRGRKKTATRKKKSRGGVPVVTGSGTKVRGSSAWNHLKQTSAKGGKSRTVLGEMKHRHENHGGPREQGEKNESGKKTPFLTTERVSP